MSRHRVRRPGPNARDRIQGPNVTHCVYNPTRSLCEGGHFLTYETLPLTRISCYLDRSVLGSSTNDIHPAMPFLIQCLANSLVPPSSYRPLSPNARGSHPPGLSSIGQRLSAREIGAIARLLHHPALYAQLATSGEEALQLDPLQGHVQRAYEAFAADALTHVKQVISLKRLTIIGVSKDGKYLPSAEVGGSEPPGKPSRRATPTWKSLFERERKARQGGLAKAHEDTVWLHD